MQLSLPLSGSLPPEDGKVVFVRHRRARRYILRVLHDGSVRVTLPRWGVTRDAHAFLEASRAWIEKQRALVRARDSGARRLDAATEALLRARATRELPQQLLALAAEHNISVSRISVRNQRTRWGACSPTGAITLNWRLIQAPDHVREYVLIHELMHRRELNHSRRFWRLVAAACPRMAEARAWLKHEGKRLWSDTE